jgi:periplasmic copper chaperone A
VGYSVWLLGCVAALLACCIALSVRAADFRSGDLIVAQPWSPPTPPVATVGAVYFSLINKGFTPRRLTAISSPAARQVEIHESRLVQGMIQMRPVTFVDCPPGSTVRSEPGGLHVMLVGLSRPLTPGMQFPLSMTFQDGGVLDVVVTVSARK